MIRYIVLDTETGGLLPNCSLLTLYLAVLNDKLELEKELDLALIPDDGVYKVEPAGMAVNKIDLVELGNRAITYSQAKAKLAEFISTVYGENPRFDAYPNELKLIPIGHGTKGDLDIVQANLMTKANWEKFCSYRFICTSNSLQFLRFQGKVPRELSGSLTSLAEYFKLEWEGESHTAKADALMTAKVLKELAKL